MTLQEKRFNFEEEIERLEDELKETAETAAGLDDANPEKANLLEEGRKKDSYLQGVRWANGEWDVDGVTLGGLTGGEFGKVEDGLREDGVTGNGATRVFLVESGTVEAPYIDDSMSQDERTAAVSQLPITFLKWAKAQVDDLTTVGGNGSGKRFADWYEESQSRQNSTES